MTVTREQVIEQARRYLGVKYQNQGRDFNGVDCGGLLLVIGRELGLTELEHLGYSNSPDGETFERLLNENCDPVDDWLHPQLADVIACDYGKGLQHTALVTTLEPRLTVIHAKRAIGNAPVGSRGMRGVIEQYLYGRDLRSWVKTYRIRGVDE